MDIDHHWYFKRWISKWSQLEYVNLLLKFGQAFVQISMFVFQWVGEHWLTLSSFIKIYTKRMIWKHSWICLLVADQFHCLAVLFSIIGNIFNELWLTRSWGGGFIFLLILMHLKLEVMSRIYARDSDQNSGVTYILTQVTLLCLLFCSFYFQKIHGGHVCIRRTVCLGIFSLRNTC